MTNAAHHSGLSAAKIVALLVFGLCWCNAVHPPTLVDSWGLRVMEAWSFLDFILLFRHLACTALLEMVLIAEQAQLDMLQESKKLGRLSAPLCCFTFLSPLRALYDSAALSRLPTLGLHSWP